MSTLELRTLATEIRSRGKHDDATAESVAAALESVSKRHGHRQPWHDFRKVVIDLLHGMVSRGLTTVDKLKSWRPLGRKRDGHPNRVDRPAPPARPSTNLRGQTIDLSPSALKQAFGCVANGRGIQPDLCEALIRHGWAEWLDHTNFTPLDETHPRSVLTMTAAGEQQYAELCTEAPR